MTIRLDLIGGLDLGNGWIKGLLKGPSGLVQEIDTLSGVALMTGSTDLPADDGLAPSICALSEGSGKTAKRLPGLIDELDVSFDTPLVPDRYRRLFGSRSLTADGSYEEFDVVGRKSKAEQRLSKTLALGVVAASALTEHVLSAGSLPGDMIEVHVRVGLALPITEFMSYRHVYASELMATSHMVTVHNFATPVVIKIVFDDVQVIAEGASALYAIVAKGEPLMNAMLVDVRKRGLPLEGITATDVLEAGNIIGIDIGEGTVNFPVFTASPATGKGKFNPEASTTFTKGYGNVLERALIAMDKDRAGNFRSRKQLASFLRTQPSALKRNAYDRVKVYVDEQVDFFCTEVADHLGNVLDTVGAMTDVIYVYGGGAGAVKEKLYPVLMDKVAEMSGADGAPVLYLDSSYSRNLNREGLYIAAMNAASNKTKVTK